MRFTTALVLGAIFCGSTLLTNIAAAQAWRDAVIVMATGDSVRGQIDFADPDVSVSRFQFRRDAGASAITYGTEDVKSFVLTNPPQRFEKVEVRVTYYSIGVVPWGGNPIIGINVLDVFAEVIRSSPSITLYSVYDADRKERFFVRKGAELTELKDVSYLVERNSTTFRVHETLYEGQLRGMLADCLGPQNNSLSYDRRSLGRAVDAYIACKGELPASANTSTQRLFNLGGFILLATGRQEGKSMGWAGTFGVTAQVLSQKNRGNQFLWLDVGPANRDVAALPIYFGAFAGSYIGQGRVQPLVDVGVTTMIGNFNGGLGVAYKKRVVLAGNIHFGFIGEKTVLFTMKLSVFPRIRRE